MKGIIKENFMLRNKTGARLYHTYAEGLPIIDYHCHLSPKMIAEDHRFSNLTELLLGGDHYKWRALRSNGVEERYITGDADDEEKFEKWAELIPMTIGNPLYAWNALELKRYFDIDEALTPHNAKEIYRACNQKLASPEFSAKGLINRSNVKVVCTTDDPADDLEYHRQIAGSGFATKVLPTFRPDKIVEIGNPAFLPYVKKNGLTTYAGVLAFLKSAMDRFEMAGCRLSDHGISVLPSFTEGDPAAVFAKVINGETVSAAEMDCYRTAVLLFCGQEYARRGWTMQLHIGALRNNNTRMFEKLGPDAGFDSMDDLPIAKNLSKLLDRMDVQNALPKTILYSLNPKDNYTLGTMLGNFQQGPAKGKIQLGSGWWFNDQRDGMEAQMRALANLGLLPRFVGMLTDSRSFVSYPRHEYFRRIFCNLIGDWVENGEYPEDDEYLGEIVRGVCYENAAGYFGF